MLVFDLLLIFYVSIKENDALRFLLAEGLVYAETDEIQDKLTSTGQLNIFCAAPILRSLILSEIQSPPINISVDDVPDCKTIDPRWLLAHTVEVSLGQNYFTMDTILINFVFHQYSTCVCSTSMLMRL